MIRVLAVTSEWPTPARPDDAIFITRQIDAVRAAGVDVDVEYFRGATNPLNYAKARRRVRRRLRTGRYDIVHAHFGQAGLAVMPSRVPSVVTFYGSDIVGIVGPRGTYTARGIVLSRLSHVVARLADEVIVLSESLGRRLPQGVDYVVIPTAVDLDVFRPGPKDEARSILGLPADRKLVLFAGRREAPVKRYELAQRAIESLAPELSVDLLTISGLPPIGVATYMRACDALLLTSKHEGGPTIVKEALATGLPVVAVDVGDVRETIGDVPGCIVSSDDSPETLSVALDQVLRVSATVGGPHVWSRLDKAKQASKILEVYERVVRGDRRRSGSGGR